MQKDVIYIDVEDDITAIIGKVKSAKEKVVALVPPKRIGVLQSAVNLRLLARAADRSDKRLVLITTNQALSSLAASAKIPVAKNLQSKPELASIPILAVDDDDDIIDGVQLPVGELARTADTKPTGTSVPASAIAGLDIDDDTPRATAPKGTDKPGKANFKSGVKVPNFSTFRKRLLLFGGLGLLIIAFFIWALFFAPRATVVISAKTTDTPVKTQVAIGATLTTSADAATLQSIVQQQKDASSVDFDATGTQDIGESATGTMTLTKSSPGSKTIDYGSGFSNGNCTFVTQSQATVPGATPGAFNGSGFGLVAGTVDVKVKSTNIGEECNLSARGYDSTVEGITASGGQMSGGVKKTIKIVTAADIQAATQKLKTQNGTDTKNVLKAKFGSDVIVIDDSFVANSTSPISTPAIGKEAPDGKAKLASDVTYMLSAVSKSELAKFLKPAIEIQLTKSDEQKIYEDGSKSAKLNGFKTTGDTTSIVVDATGKVGPRIDEQKIKERVKGMRYGEVQSTLKDIEGVSDADTKFRPFWVKSVPNDVKKIQIEFKLQNA